MNNKLNTIRYIIYRVAQEFNKYHKQDENDNEYFNNHNNFTLEKCLMLPYVIVISSIHKNFFINDIFKNSFLPVLTYSDFKSRDKENSMVLVVDYINNDTCQYTPELLGFNFKGDRLQINFEDFSKEVIDFGLQYKIDTTIRFFIEYRFKDFAILHESIIKKITSQNSAYEVIFDYFSPEKFRGKLEDYKFKLSVLFQTVIEGSFYFLSYIEGLEKRPDYLFEK